MKVCLLLAILFVAPALTAEDAAKPDRVTRVVEVKSSDLGNLASLLHVLGVEVSNRAGSFVALRGTKDAVDTAEMVIRKIDAQPAMKPVREPDIELTAFLITASPQPVQGTLPPGLDPVVKQLKSVFPYRGFRLLDSFVIRAVSGQGGRTDGVIPSLATDHASVAQYAFKFNSIMVVQNQGRRDIRIEGVDLGLTLPAQTGGTVNPAQQRFMNSDLRTSVEIREGQKAVIGKATISPGADGALFVVLSATVVD